MAHYRFIATGDLKPQPRPVDCSFQVLTAAPTQLYQELGVLEARNAALDAKGFASDVHEQVCRAGGDAVLVQVDGQGRYLRGTVLKLGVAEQK